MGPHGPWAPGFEPGLPVAAVLRGISPLIWRRLLSRPESAIADLHQLLQLSFGWSDARRLRFFIHGREYGGEREGGIWFDRDQVVSKRFVKKQQMRWTPPHSSNSTT